MSHLDPDPHYEPNTWVSVDINPRTFDDPVVLQHPLEYTAGKYTFTVPARFGCDGASVPFLRIFFRIIRPFILHDFLYRRGCFRRKIADGIMLDAMRYDGFPWLMRWVVYFGVRAFGWRAWRRRRK